MHYNPHIHSWSRTFCFYPWLLQIWNHLIVKMKQQCYTAAHMYLFSIVVLVMVAKNNLMEIYIRICTKFHHSISTKSIRRDIDGISVFISTFQWKVFCCKREQNFFCLDRCYQSSQLNCLFMQCCYYGSIAVQYA